MKKYFQVSKIPRLTAGFTLIELLVAMLITSIVVTLTGSGLVLIMQKNNAEEAENISQTNINRALDFISDEVRMANSASDTTTAPAWATGIDLGTTGSPTAQLYLQMSLLVQNMTSTTDLINIPQHGFSSGNAVMFTGAGNIAGGASKNTVYYVIKYDADNFKLASSLANVASNTAIDLTSNSNGSLIGHRLVIYYIREHTSTWLGAKTINRSVGPCVSPYDQSNCPELVDSIASSGFSASVTNSRLVNLQLQGQLDDNTTPKIASPVSTSVSVRNN